MVRWVVLAALAIIGVFGSNPARAEEIELSCKFDDGAKVVWEINDKRVIFNGQLDSQASNIAIGSRSISWSADRLIANNGGVYEHIQIDRLTASVHWVGRGSDFKIVIDQSGTCVRLQTSAADRKI